MKAFVVLVLVSGLTSLALADIQDPPANDYGPTRKLGRGLANLFLASSEIFVTVTTVNAKQGNAAAAGYGVVRGLGRSAARHLAGFLDLVCFPVPSCHDSYYPILPAEVPYIHAGYSEFPPELGFETRYPYVREY